MIYKKFQELELSMLGLGTMRLPVMEGNDAVIDEKAAAEMVAYAMKQGINYYDTAWGYHGGNSEIVMGKILKNYPRESFYLASKFPGYDLSNMEKIEDVFEKQLEKCGVEYFDFYLFHNVCEKNIDAYLDEKYGLFDYLMKQKEEGRIKHLGFSAHGNMETMTRFLEAYGEYMEFGQLQLNWLDWTLQSAKEKVELLEKYNIPVWVMEPLRGGKLATVSEEYEEELKELRPQTSVPEWAFRFLQSIPSVTMILSGMSNMEQLQDNIKTFEIDEPLNEEEMKAILAVADDMLENKILPCTSCRYCVSYCPKGLNIPALIELYNEHNFTGGGFIAPMALAKVPQEKQPGACVGCRSCEAVCPQQIKISEAMADFAVKLK